MGNQKCSIKVDIFKAYDTVDWQLIFDILETLGFLSRFVDWIKECISTPKFSTALNGSLVGSFRSNRGLGQGDPISPLLFVLVLTVWAGLFQEESFRNGFELHSNCKRLDITHLCFTDDPIIFSSASTKAVSTIREAIRKFSKFTRLKPSM